VSNRPEVIFITECDLHNVEVSFRLILPVRLIPRLFLLWEHDFIRPHEPREHSAGDVRGEVDLLFESRAARRHEKPSIGKTPEKPA